LKRLIKHLLIGRNPVSEYPVIGLSDPQALVAVHLMDASQSQDVTRNHVIVSLRPLRMAICLEQNSSFALSTASHLRLVFSERGPKKTVLGYVALRYESEFAIEGASVSLFRVVGYRNACVSLGRQTAYDLVRWWSARKKGKAFNHQMSRSHLHAFYVLYSCPRPVALVSFEVNGHGNIFPMDLLGPVASGHMLLALHNTSPSLSLMKSAEGVALSEAPVELRPEVYQIGANHRTAQADWDALPLELYRTPTLQAFAPTLGLGTLELEIQTTLDAGSHTLFVTRPIAYQHLANGKRLHHVQGFCYQRLLAQSSVTSRDGNAEA
jgi:flavin reductase (DIM6/NTAB) family NADH-FMN oxidoreductase RutF